MKKVSDFFDLPVGSDTGMIIDSECRQCGEFNLMVEANAAARAINNVDALADALAAALPALKYNRSISDSADRIYTDAALALQAYRGTK